MQTDGSELPGMGFAWPAAHGRQNDELVAPRSGLYVPPGQRSNVMLALAAPRVAQKPPTGHASHSIAPKVLLNEPIAHAGQESAATPVAFEAVPGVHGMQFARLEPRLDGGKCEPAGHGSGTDVAATQ